MSNESEVVVPNVVGMTVPAARHLAHVLGLVVTAEDLDGPPLGALTWPGVWIVTSQSPEPGSRQRRAGRLIVQFQRAPGDSAGDREPRHPIPPLDSLSGERDPDLSHEA
jgi:hypothetical protein